MACIFFSICSEKFDIVEVLHKIQIWDKLTFQVQTIFRIPVETVGEEITR